MEILLTVAVLAVGAAVLYVAATVGTRIRQNTAPLIDDAAKDISEHIDATAGDMSRQLQAIGDELHQDREQASLDRRKIQGRLDHADSRVTTIANQLLAELETIRRLGEQAGARQDQFSADLRRLASQVAQLGESLARSSAAGQPAGEAPSAEPGAPETAGAPAGHADEPTPRVVIAGSFPIVPGQLYAERLVFAIIRTQPESWSGSERHVRIQVERYVGQLPRSQLGDLGSASAITERAEKDVGFRARLSEAASDYFATKWGDPAFAVATERWVTQNAYPETAAADVCNQISKGLDTIVERPLEKIGTELRLPGPEAATAAGIGSALILQPVTKEIGQVTRFLEITGVVVGMVTGLHPLALAAAKMLAHDQFHTWVARGLRVAARTVFEGPQGPATSPEPVREPAAPGTRPAEVRPAEVRPAATRPAEKPPAGTGPAPASPSPSTLWEPPRPRPDTPHGPSIGGPGSG